MFGEVTEWKVAVDEGLNLMREEWGLEEWELEG